MSEHCQLSFLDLCGEVLMMRSADHYCNSDKIISTYPEKTTFTGHVESLKLSLKNLKLDVANAAIKKKVTVNS